MSDNLQTPRFALPMLSVAQAQKETTHNEALVLIDALLHAPVVDGPLPTPPEDPTEGDCWIVDEAPIGEWSGEAGRLALWTAGGWRFVAPSPGMRVRRISDGATLLFNGSGWTVPIAIANPEGGATIDLEARAAIDALLALMVAHGIMIAG